MNQQEIRILEDIPKALKSINSTIKDANDTHKKIFNNTNKNTVLSKIVESMASTQKSIDDLNATITSGFAALITEMKRNNTNK